jgi:hypothetical protein
MIDILKSKSSSSRARRGGVRRGVPPPGGVRPVLTIHTSPLRTLFNRVPGPNSGKSEQIVRGCPGGLGPVTEGPGRAVG